jgi:hypothetical protein
MSDLQIVTGISVMISGYAQLQCGISCFDWQMFLYIAWFSSLTHFSCLTFLRSYLYRHKGERVWRLVGMGLLVVMLFFGFLPTWNYKLYDWVNNRHIGGGDTYYPGYADYAVCYLVPRVRSSSSVFPPATAVLTLVALIWAYILRVILLHKHISCTTLPRYRQALSKKFGYWLQVLRVTFEGYNCIVIW